MSEELAVIEQPALAVQPVSLFGEKSPAAVVSAASETADALMDVVKKRGLAKRISGREYLLVEAWTLLGSMLGVFPVCEWTREVEDGWEARVEARTLSGAVVGAAEAECLRSEKNWRTRDDYALRSMAQTRAIAKALRMPLGFIAVLAGFEATPADEMPTDREPEDKPAKKAELQKAMEDTLAALALADPSVDWKARFEATAERNFGEPNYMKLTVAQLKPLLTDAQNSLANVNPPVPF